MLSAYCLSYGNWTVIPSHWDFVFEDMRQCGFDAVALSFSESEKQYSMRTFEQQVAIAHKHGLQVLAIPSRLGGRFAGAPYMSSPWLTANPASQVPGNPALACLHDPNYLNFVEDFIRMLVTSFEIDGLILDEPKGTDVICTHPETLNRYGASPTVENMHTSMLGFLQFIIDLAKKIRPELSITLFNLPISNPVYTAKSAALPGIDFAGFDGPCSPQSFFHEEPNRTKCPILKSWERIQNEAKGKTGTFALLENILIPDSAIPEFKQEFVKALDTITADHLSVYYYGHNNESAELIQKFCMDEVKKRYGKNS